MAPAPVPMLPDLGGLLLQLGRLHLGQTTWWTEVPVLGPVVPLPLWLGAPAVAAVTGSLVGGLGAALLWWRVRPAPPTRSRRR